jgi:DNA-binding NtrC family response regulator
MLPENDPFDSILGESLQTQAIRAFGRRAASVDAPVLISGETGTGKGVLARAIHEASARRRGPLVSVNCTGVPESLFESEFFGHVRGAFTGALQAHRGLLEQAHRGTLFLDEIGELPLSQQPKLLVALEDAQFRRVGAERLVEVDLRLIAATAVDLLDAVTQQKFRRDLYHRIRVLAFVLPPLRQRGDDLLLLAAHFVQRFADRYCSSVKLSQRACAILRSYDWPGNIRELAHTIESAVVAAESEELVIELPNIDQTRTSQLQPAFTDSVPRYSFPGSDSEERILILNALKTCRGNKTHTARYLGMSRNTLLDKLRRWQDLSQTAMDDNAPTAHPRSNNDSAS